MYIHIKISEDFVRQMTPPDFTQTAYGIISPDDWDIKGNPSSGIFIRETKRGSDGSDIGMLKPREITENVIIKGIRKCCQHHPEFIACVATSNPKFMGDDDHRDKVLQYGLFGKLKYCELNGERF